MDKRFDSMIVKPIYVVIPNTGCSGCITVAENFLKESIKDSVPVRFILTRIASLKGLKYKLKMKVMDHDKIILDTLNRVNYPDISRAIYPMIIYPPNTIGKNFKIEYQSPKSGGFENLVNYLNQHS